MSPAHCATIFRNHARCHPTRTHPRPHVAPRLASGGSGWPGHRGHLQQPRARCHPTRTHPRPHVAPRLASGDPDGSVTTRPPSAATRLPAVAPDAVGEWPSRSSELVQKGSARRWAGRAVVGMGHPGMPRQASALLVNGCGSGGWGRCGAFYGFASSSGSAR